MLKPDLTFQKAEANTGIVEDTSVTAVVAPDSFQDLLDDDVPVQPQAMTLRQKLAALKDPVEKDYLLRTAIAQRSGAYVTRRTVRPRPL